MTIIVSALFITTATLLFYAWVVYPLLMTARRSTTVITQNTIDIGKDCRPQTVDCRQESQQLTTNAPPAIVLLSAFNEADVIADRIANITSLDYPREKLRVLVGTDGCTDDTAAVASKAAAGNPGIKIIVYKENRGKVAVLRDLVSEAQLDETQLEKPLLVFTDANTRFRADALRQLVKHFTDASVGGVCGRLIFTGSGSDAEQSYWNLENKLKHRESELDSCLGANGAIYALRPECFWQTIPTNTIVDDFVIGMKVRETGWRMRYDPNAIAEEDVPAVQDEWQRRVRIGSGDYQAASFCRACLHPRFGWFAWSFWSHKILRWFSPHLILIMMGAAALRLIDQRDRTVDATIDTLALIVLTGAVLMLTAALAGKLSRQIGVGGTFWTLCCGIEHFVTMQAALLVGFVRYCRGNLSGAWSRTPRTQG